MSIAFVACATALVEITLPAPAAIRSPNASSAKMPWTATHTADRMPSRFKWPIVSIIVRPVETISSTKTGGVIAPTLDVRYGNFDIPISVSYLT